MGGVIFFMGLFPFAMGLDSTIGIGVSQILATLAGLFLLVFGAYVVAYAMLHRGQPPNLMRDIGVRLGMTGLVIATAAALADVMGFGSHSAQVDGVLFGWLQAAGLMGGFIISALGVMIYGISGTGGR